MPDAVLISRIERIKAKSVNGGQQVDEYLKFMTHVRDRAPQRLLVWGLGYDSSLLAELNAHGTTLFLEADVSSVARSSAANLSYFRYDRRQLGRTTVNTTAEFVKAPRRAHRIRPLDANGTCWDTILVDSPMGWLQHHPSRAVPTYTAKVDTETCAARHAYSASGGCATIWVHECDRPGEDFLTQRLLGPSVSETGRKKLREFRICSSK